jgi:hypothetical protein
VHPPSSAAADRVSATEIIGSLDFKDFSLLIAIIARHFVCMLAMLRKTTFYMEQITSQFGDRLLL